MALTCKACGALKADEAEWAQTGMQLIVPLSELPSISQVQALLIDHFKASLDESQHALVRSSCVNML